MANGEETPIIVKKVVKGHGHHGGAWKVAYADFVTAMMALFIVLWILSSTNANTKAAIAKYFKDPIGFSDKSTGIIDMPGSGIIDNQIDFEAQYREIEKAKFEEMGDEIMNEISGNTELSDLADQITIEMVEEGMRIELNESADNVFFQIGSAELNKKSVKILKKIGSELGNLNNKVIIEGHTDSRPFVTGNGNYTNYELSCDRANAARRALIAGGLPSEMIFEVRGLADKMLRNKKDPYSITNRRISIIVKYSKANE